VVDDLFGAELCGVGARPSKARSAALVPSRRAEGAWTTAFNAVVSSDAATAPAWRLRWFVSASTDPGGE
jgi:hypothetical protein